MIPFRGGLFLKREKRQAEAMPIEALPAPFAVMIPLVQHSGAPARPMAGVGDRVAMGQTIGEAVDGASAPVHASVSGTVTRISRYHRSTHPDARCIEIENDGKDEFASPIPYEKPWTESTAAELIKKISLSGIVDAYGGIAIHAKLSAAADRKIDTLLVAALAPEGAFSADLQLLREQTEKALVGISICMKIIEPRRCCIALDEQASDLAVALDSRLADERFKGISLVKLKAKYPQHDERLLIGACTGTALPSAIPSIERGFLVLSAATTVAIRDAVMECIPFYRRVVTVAGPLAASPKNLLVRIGTPVGSLLEACGVDLSKTVKVVSGGVMAGATLHDVREPVVKSTVSLTALEVMHPALGSHPCIRCGRCVSVCPMRLMPSQLFKLAGANDFRGTVEYHIMECIECGCCAYVCPSKINLIHYIAFAKRMVDRERRLHSPLKKETV